MFDQKLFGARRSTFAPAIALSFAVLVSGACVSQQKYDETQLAAKHYQKTTFDYERQIAALETEVASLRRQLKASETNVQSASADLDERLRSLNEKIAELGANPGDITKFRVDGGYVYQVKEAILFALGSADLSEDGRKALVETVAPDINSRAHGRIYVRGHTDSVPVKKPETLAKFPHGNLQLSSARAVEVAALLIEKGKVANDRVVVMGFGPSDPVAANDSAENRQKNRRVEIFVSDEGMDAQPMAKPAEASTELTDDVK
ncbi:MAG: OmpA family protein [Planctomycetes bacterium]|nr:OmpA family protein [Planctomycetota bacterium]